MIIIDKGRIRDLLKKEDPVILEIGANTGLDTLEFLKLFSDVKIYCFEPDPRCVKQFNTNVKDKRCFLSEEAVSDEDGYVDLNMSVGYPCLLPGFIKRLHLSKPYLFAHNIYMKSRHSRDWNQSSSIMQSVSYSEGQPWLYFNKKIKVKTVRLDTWVKENDIKAIDFIWADLQGAEKKMIAGATDTLKIVKYLYCEYGENSVYPEAMTRAETISLMQKHNFQLLPEFSDAAGPGNLLFVNMGKD